jgi:hypothetical protein
MVSLIFICRDFYHVYLTNILVGLRGSWLHIITAGIFEVRSGHVACTDGRPSGLRQRRTAAGRLRALRVGLSTESPAFG